MKRFELNPMAATRDTLPEVVKCHLHTQLLKVHMFAGSKRADGGPVDFQVLSLVHPSRNTDPQQL